MPQNEYSVLMLNTNINLQSTRGRKTQLHIKYIQTMSVYNQVKPQFSRSSELAAAVYHTKTNISTSRVIPWAVHSSLRQGDMEQSN